MRMEEVNTAGYLHTDTVEKEAVNNSLRNRKEEQKNTDKNSFYAGGLNLGTDIVEEKRKKARDMAVDLMKDVFSRDNAYSDDLDGRRSRAKELESENAAHTEILKDIEKEREGLKELYGISENSTKEELEVYEKEKQRLDETEAEYKKKIEDNTVEILQENAIVRGMKIEHLKQHDMADAVKQGEDIMKAASKDIIGMLRDEVKDNIDKKAEEEKEKAKEKKEKEEELTEQIEAAKADDMEEVRKERKEEKQREEMYEIGTAMDQVKKTKEQEAIPETEKSMNQVINELMLSTEDLKGLVVDENT